MNKHTHLRNELASIIESTGLTVITSMVGGVDYPRPYATIYNVGEQRVKPQSERGTMHAMEHRFLVLVRLEGTTIDTTYEERDRIACDIEYAVRTSRIDDYDDTRYTVSVQSATYDGASDVIDDGSGKAEAMYSITIQATHKIKVN